MIFKYSPVAAVVAGLLFSVSAIAAESSTTPAGTTVTAITGTSPEQASIPADATATNSEPSSDAAKAQPVSTAQAKSVVIAQPDAATQAASATIVPAEKSTTQASETHPDKTPALSPESSSPGSAIAPVVSQPAPLFTPEQEGRIGEVTKQYLLAHPEVLLEVSRELQAQQREQQTKAVAAAVIEHQDALLNDKSTPSYGPADAKVALIEFFDYQCSACAREAPVLGAVMKANPEVRYVFKEWPILSSRWESSMTAAATGLQIWTQKGENAYMLYHDAIFATGHNEGKLTLQDIRNAAAHVGKLSGKISSMLDTLEQTNALAQNLGIQATPGVIVMPVSGANIDNVTVIPGEASQEMLQAAINKASE